MKNNNICIYNKIKPFLGNIILEIGSGLGTISKYLVSKERKTILTDINDEYLNYLNTRFIANPWVTVIKMDVTNFDKKLIDEKLDTIVSINILEHIENDLDVLKRLKEGLIENGKLLLIVPAHKVLFGSLDMAVRHYRRYAKKELIDKLKNAGFIIEKIEYMNFLSAIGWFISFRLFRRRRMPVMAILLADKLVPFISLIEKFIRFPFGLSLFAVARRK